MSEPDDGGRHRLEAGSETSFGVEDVLGAPPQGAVTKHAATPTSRTSPWSRRRDKVLAAVITVAFLLAASLVWATSDTRATTSDVAVAGPDVPPAPDVVPGSLAEIWQAPSASAPVPVTGANTVVSADGGEVAGRDPITGAIRWRYARDLQLCTVAAAWSKVNAVYRHEGVDGLSGCSEVTQLDPATGRRTAQRNGDAELGTRLVSDGSHVTTTGKKLLNSWRDDLVKSMEYGEVRTLVKPNVQPRTGCTFGTVAAAAGNVGVIERCPGDPADRLTVYKSSGGEADEPKPVFSSVLAGRSAKVVAMSGESTAVALPEQKLLVIYGIDGTQRAAYPLDLPAADLAQDPPGGVETTSATASAVYWFTGSKTLALSIEDLTPKWTLDSAAGPGITFANQLVVPIKGGLAVLNEADGSTIRTIGVDRRGYSGPVQLGTIGPVLLEQRGDTLVALR
ncbi:MAG: hypothetical protein QOI21_6086 [Actinomycetota bacterium]|nr:hypothetical protein [Actinomycetota bacterium]